jgi:chemosensory pili system protein ChpA (sensor histidine kinase/response regulator)
MARHADPEVIAGFLEEARGYLPQIRQGIEAYRADSNQREPLEEAHRRAHSIKGAAAMVGLADLSHIAFHLEEAIEDVLAGRLALSDEVQELLGKTVAQIESCLEQIARGTRNEQPLLEEVVQAYRHLRGLSAAEPQATVERIVAGIEDAASPAEPAAEPPAPATEPAKPPSFASAPPVLETAAGPAESEASLELLEAFVLEAEDGLRQISTQLTQLEQQPTDRDLLQEIRRGVHALKGGAAMVGLRPIARLAHRMEDLLDLLYQGATAVAPDVMALLFASADALDDLVADKDLTDTLPRLYERYSALLGEADDAAPDASAALAEKKGSLPAAPAPGDEPDEGEAVTDVVLPELVEVFALEAEDHLRNISTLLPALEQQPDNKELLQDIRRSAHTLKGSAATVGFRKITRLAHRMEDLLDLLYEGGAAVTPETIQLLFASTDALEDLAQCKGDEAAVRDLYERYSRLLGQTHSREVAVAAATATGVDEVPAEDQAGELAARLGQTAIEPQPEKAAHATPRRAGQVVRVPLERLDELVKLVSELVITRTAFEQRLADHVRQMQELQLSTERLRRVSGKLETQYEARTLGGGRSFGRMNEEGGRMKGNRAAALLLGPASFESYGFDDLEFDRYTDFHLLSRELAESTTDIHTVGSELEALNGDFDSYLNRQARLSSEIQDKLMRVRMVPLATLASRLHRTVRTVANQQGKQVELVLEGEDTELDKTVLEEMADPLLHLLRNAVDHGIEPPALREVRGKPAHGQIRLRAYHEGTQVVIQIRDDGVGVEPQVVRAAAVRGGFVAAADAERLTDDELLNLVFLPGFSTAREVSEVSGRGVGLDIVKSNVHKLKGTLTLTSQPGEGATFTIRLPLTLAITRALLVKAHGQTFAIPLSVVTQILRLEQADREQVGQEPVLRVNGRVYPRIELGKAMNLKQPADETVTRQPVLLLNLGDRQVALVVDRLLGGREIVIKNLGTHVRQLHGITGATLMGDGTVVLIVNPAELVREPVRARPTPRMSAAAPARPTHRALTVLVVDDSPSVRRVVSNLIKSAGWTPVAAKDGLEALELLHHATTPPDLILLDVEMPRMDGYELLATLKRQGGYQQIPVVMVTSRAGEKHRRKALDLGASGYVVKPYQDEELLQTIRELVRESQPVAAV